MKLEVGMYVRTNSGIRKLEIIDNDGTYKFDDEIYNEYGDVLIWLDGDAGELDMYITKASHNIIDLIEEGDYVNDYKVLFIDKDLSETKNIKCIDNSEERQCFYEEDIKSIVTKEQFESMSYKVGE